MTSGKIHTARDDKMFRARTGKAFPAGLLLAAPEDELLLMRVLPADLTLVASREVLPASVPLCTDAVRALISRVTYFSRDAYFPPRKRPQHLPDLLRLTLIGAQKTSGSGLGDGLDRA